MSGNCEAVNRGELCISQLGNILELHKAAAGTLATRFTGQVCWRQQKQRSSGRRPYIDAYMLEGVAPGANRFARFMGDMAALALFVVVVDYWLNRGRGEAEADE